MRTLAIAAIMTLALTTGCGSDEEGTAADGVKPPATAEHLTPEQFDAAERIFVATVAIDDLDDGASMRELEPVVRDVARACDEAAATGDALLVALSAGCDGMAAFAEAGAGAENCDGATACGRQIVAAAEKLEEMLEKAREALPTVEAALVPGACRDVLTEVREIELMSELAANLRAMGQAMVDGDDDAALRAAHRGTQIVKRAERLPDAREHLAKFRRACAPRAS